MYLQAACSAGYGKALGAWKEKEAGRVGGHGAPYAAWPHEAAPFGRQEEGRLFSCVISTSSSTTERQARLPA